MTMKRKLMAGLLAVMLAGCGSPYHCPGDGWCYCADPYGTHCSTNDPPIRE